MRGQELRPVDRPFCLGDHLGGEEDSPFWHNTVRFVSLVFEFYLFGDSLLVMLEELLARVQVGGLQGLKPYIRF